MHHAPAQHRVGLRRVSRYAHGLILALLAGLVLAAAPAAAQPTCGQTITEDTTLTTDLQCGVDGPPLVIGAPGITLDLGGHAVQGDQAILNQGHDDVTIQNGFIANVEESIRLEGVSGNVIRDIETTGLIQGITVVDSSATRVVDNRLVSVGLLVQGSDHILVARNTSTKFEGGVGLIGTSHSRVVDNIVWVGRDGAFSLSGGSHHNEVRRNVFLNDTFAVIGLYDARDNELVGNTIGSSGPPAGAAGEIVASDRNLLARNTVFGVGQGFRVGSGAGNVFRRNDLSGVPLVLGSFVPDGFAVAASASGTVLRDNRVRGFDDDGIDVDAAGTRLGGNSSDDNGDLGIEAVPGVIDLGGNTASGNGNPLQCTNVLCAS